MSKYIPESPGPWTITDGRGGFEIKDADGQVVGRALSTTLRLHATDTVDRVTLRAEENARLMAAAPDLLDALRGMVDAMDADLFELQIAKLAAKVAIAKTNGGA